MDNEETNNQQSGEQGQQAGAGEGQQQQTQGQQQAQPQFDVNQLLAQVGETVKSALPKQEEKQMSDEDFEKMFKVFKMTPTHLKRLSGEDEGDRLAVWNEVLKGVVQQAVAMADYKTNASLEPFQKNFSSIQQYATQQQEKALLDEFYGANPKFKGREAIVNAVKSNIINSGAKYGSKTELFKALAEQTNAILATVPGLSQANNSPASNGMSTVSTGGSAGSGTTGSRGNQQDEIKQLFGG